MCNLCCSSKISIIELLYKLYIRYGPRNWWPAKTKFEVMVGAVLTQNTSWSNVEKAISNFGDNLSAYFIENVSYEELINIIKPSGFYNQKARTLKLLCQWFSNYDYNFEKIRTIPVEIVRKELLNIKGIGKETADSIILYAFDKPIFVIDKYTIRILKRLGMDLPKQYDQVRCEIENCIESFTSFVYNMCKDDNFFCKNTCNKYCKEHIYQELYENLNMFEYFSINSLEKTKCSIYNEFHALIVEHAKNFCTKKPDCSICFLNDYCKHLNI